MPRRTEGKKKRGGSKAIKIRFTPLLKTGYLDLLVLIYRLYIERSKCAVV